MKRIPRTVLVAAGLALCLFLPKYDARPVVVREVDAGGESRVVSPAVAAAQGPEPGGFAIEAPVDDLAYALAAAGPEGAAALLGAFALGVLLWSLWTRGVRCGARRVLAVFSLGAWIGLSLLYHSCFLPGVRIALGPESSGWVLASLHTQTNRTTGLLGPAHLVRWHIDRGFDVLNVSDGDTIDGALEARREAEDLGAGLLVVVGEEWHGSPHIVLVNAQRAYARDEMTPEELLADVHEKGGAAALAHPWSHLPRGSTLEQVLALPFDAMEVFNGRIHGGRATAEAARRRGKALLGVTDYKFGPHVTAATLIPASLASRAEDVVLALRTNRTRVLFAVPDEPWTPAEYDARSRWVGGAGEGLRTLFETPRARRIAWFLWIVALVALHRFATRNGEPGGRPVLWRAVFYACCLGELALLAGLSWQVRAAVGPIPVPLLVAAGALLAVPLLASSHNLTGAEA